MEVRYQNHHSPIPEKRGDHRVGAGNPNYEDALGYAAVILDKIYSDILLS